MKEYRVKWEIEVFADSPEDAARWALATLRDLDSTATVFDVKRHRRRTVRVDLTLNKTETL